MSNSVSTVNNDLFAKKARHEDLARQGRLTTLSPGQQQFDTGTMNLLNEARGVVENAVGQGQELNPMIYQMLGLQPQYEDNSADLDSARQESEAAQAQMDEANKQIATLKGIPGKQRTPQQKKQLNVLKKQLAGLGSAVEKTKDIYSRMETMPKKITGLTRMDPNAIPSESPFSGQNPLNALQAETAARAQQYFAGGEVDPTLKHNYDQAESALRAKLEQRYGPDYENTSVGQMALQNFMQTKNRDFATWNEQQRQAYTQEAYNEQGALQNLLANRIGLLREPSSTGINYGNTLSNLAGERLAQQAEQMNFQLNRAGLAGTPTAVGASPVGAAASGGGQLLGRLLQPTVDPATGQMTGPSLAHQAGSAVYNAPSDLSNWVTGLGTGASVGNAGIAGAAYGVD